MKGVKHIICSSDLGSLHFTDKQTYNDFNREIREVWKKYHDLEVEMNGIFAGNQDKFVSDPSELNEWDSYPHRLDVKED